MKMTGFAESRSRFFVGVFPFWKTAAFPLDNPPEMCYTKSIPKPFVSGTEIQKVRNVM